MRKRLRQIGQMVGLAVLCVVLAAVVLILGGS